MIGVVEAGDRADQVVEGLRAAGFDPDLGAVDELNPAAIDVVVAVGEPALVDVVGAGFGVPICPVDVDDGLSSVGIADVPSTVEAYLAGDATASRHQLLSVRIDDEALGPALFEVMMVRSEPGRISEFSLSADEAQSRFRADGVVAATPAGSHGYARSAGGPRLGSHTGSVVVVPVAAFGLGAPTWVLDPQRSLELRVERDEGDVSVLVDGRLRRTLSGRAAVTLTLGGALETIGIDSG